MELITRPMKPRLDSLPCFPDALDNKRALNVRQLTHNEQGVKTNPFLSRPVDRKARGDAMPNKNLLGFISSDGMNNPLIRKSKAMFLSGE